MKRVAILGSTGSIGTSALEVIAALPDNLEVVGLTAHQSWKQLCEQAEACRPRFVTLTDEAELANADKSMLPPGTDLLEGSDRVERIVSHSEVDVVLTAVVGAAGLRGTLAALEASKTLAIANKETLVLAGQYVMRRAHELGVTVLPVDSEHSALFQSLRSGQSNEILRMLLTGSGGPFRTWSPERIERATAEEALKHPTWSMGPKITIDSATMMNKALEIVEAKWLFDVTADKIEVLVHPESIIHSIVEFVDHSMIAQLSTPDMKLPIQYALCFPDRLPCPTQSLDLVETASLSFEAADYDRFPSLRLGLEVAERGGTTGAVVNAANEVAVDRFLNGELNFGDIVRVSCDVLANHNFDSAPPLDELIRADVWARREAGGWS